MIEKHFTDDNSRSSDHEFSMNFKTWKKMVEQTRILEQALGDGKKRLKKMKLKVLKFKKEGFMRLKI